MSALLTVRDLHVGFGRDPKANEVVKGVSFDLAAGKTLAIVGESGSGKSVTALSINRLVNFGGGRITGGSISLQRSDGRVPRKSFEVVIQLCEGRRTCRKAGVEQKALVACRVGPKRRRGALQQLLSLQGIWQER